MRRTHLSCAEVLNSSSLRFYPFRMPDYTLQDVASTIDHAVLKPESTVADVRQNADYCLKTLVASMCVRPCDIKLASDLLSGSPVLVSSVLSFPHGADATASKRMQAEQAIDHGVQEIDMVMNIGRFLSGSTEEVREDIRAVVDMAHAADIPVKVIQESCFLTLDQVALACTLAYEAGADYVKTSTGFGPSGATPEVIEVMVKTVGGRMGIKASGGIRTWEQAISYLEQGATRLGIGATQTVLAGGVAESGY